MATRQSRSPHVEGRLLDVDLRHLRRQLETSRDNIFSAAGVDQDRFLST